MTIGQRIAERRAELGMTQEELAKMVGCSQTTLSDLESGKATKTSYVARLALHLQVHALWLETGELPRLLSDEVPRPTPLSASESEVLDLVRWLTVRQQTELKATLTQQKQENIQMARELRELRPLLNSLEDSPANS